MQDSELRLLLLVEFRHEQCVLGQGRFTKLSLALANCERLSECRIRSDKGDRCW